MFYISQIDQYLFATKFYDSIVGIMKMLTILEYKKWQKHIAMIFVI